MKAIEFLTTVYKNSRPLHSRGEVIAHTPEAEVHVRRGIAKIVDVEEPKAEKPSRKSKGRDHDQEQGQPQDHDQEQGQPQDHDQEQGQPQDRDET